MIFEVHVDTRDLQSKNHRFRMRKSSISAPKIIDLGIMLDTPTGKSDWGCGVSPPKNPKTGLKSALISGLKVILLMIMMMSEDRQSGLNPHYYFLLLIFPNYPIWVIWGKFPKKTQTAKITKKNLKPPIN